MRVRLLHRKGEPRPLPDSASYRRMLASPEYLRRRELALYLSRRVERELMHAWADFTRDLFYGDGSKYQGLPRP